MADPDTPDIQYGDGRMGPPAPKRRQYAAPFGTLQNDAPMQFGDGQRGPAPREPANALAMRPIAAPFGMLPTAGLTSEPPPPSPTDAPPDRVLTPMGWAPTRLASILADALTPSQQGVDATVAAPADAAKWWARKLGVSGPSPAPSSAGFIADTLGAPADAAAWAARRLGISTPDINALAQTLRRRF
jgi:hypothetical protein